MASFSSVYSSAWRQLRLSDRKRPDEVFPTFTKEDFDTLKSKYQEEHGYYIRIPKLEDMIHWKPQLLKSLEEVKAEKRQGLMNILASPAPEWARMYSTIMTWMDNIQDAGSVVYPGFSMLLRWAPKVFGKVLPIMGWIMLGTDLLNMAIAVGRLPMTGMGGKRLICDYFRQNPFTKKAQWLRKERIKNYKPGVADLIQVAQTTDNITGVGLSLGPLMGFIQDAIFGGYRYLTGERVRVGFDVPDMWEHEAGGRKGLQAMGLISSSGQVFSDEIHLFSYIVGATSARLYTPWAHQVDIVSAVENPMDIMIPASYPTNQTTIDVIREEGLDVESGIGWPYNEGKEISVNDLWDALMPTTRDTFRDYSIRHSKDWFGYVPANMLDQVLPSIGWAFDPTGEIEYDDTPEMKTLFRMIKGELLPTKLPSERAGLEFMDWLKRQFFDIGKTPGLMAIKEAFERFEIPYRESFPTERLPEADEYWPKDLDINQYNMA